MIIKKTLLLITAISAIALTAACGGDGGRAKAAGESGGGNMSARAAQDVDADTATAVPVPPAADTSYFTDKRDGRKYRTVKIGEQEWMAENLNFESDSSWHYVDDDDEDRDDRVVDSAGVRYGRLYTFRAAVSTCEGMGGGWKVPTKKEWGALIDYAGGASVAATKIKSVRGWRRDRMDKHESGGGADSYGFSALPGGYRGAGGFTLGSYCGYFWSATEGGVRHSDAYFLKLSSGSIVYDEHRAGKNTGFSVRCVKGPALAADSSADADASAATPQADVATSYFTDSRNGKKYRAVTIGDQTWMAENLNFKTGPSKKIRHRNAECGEECEGPTSWCYKEKEAHCEKYGRLYEWETALAVCPSGWHLPTSDEWTVLERAVGGTEFAGTKLRSKTGWKSNENNIAGTDDYGFSALPGGSRGHDYRSMGRSSQWWGVDTDFLGFFTDIDYNKDRAGGGCCEACGSYVRCVKDLPCEGIGTGVKVWSQDLEQSDVEGDRSLDNIRRGVAKNMASLRSIYTKRLRDRPCLSGQIDISFTINESGAVSDATAVKSTVGDLAFERFVEDSIESWKFGKIDKPGDYTEVDCRFVFER